MLALADHEISRFPSKERAHMPVSKTTPGRLGARVIAPIRVAFRHRNDVGTQDEGTFAAQWLAYALPCQRYANTLTGNRGHSMVTVDDVKTALEKHSLYLVTDFGLEVRDVSGLSEKIFYDFIGEGQRFTPEQVIEIVRKRAQDLSPQQIVDLLLWYGFLGIPDSRNRPVYIYNRDDYDYKRLEAERDRLGDNLIYYVNAAFLEGLRD